MSKSPVFHRPSWVDQTKQKPLYPQKVSLLCCGIGGPERAAAEAGWKWQAVNVIDIAEFLKPAVERLHAYMGTPKNALKIGSASGDLLRFERGRFKELLVGSDGLVAGPCCPPWSPLGKQGARGDPRARVFLKVLEIIEWLAHSEESGAQLKWFVIENVVGISHRIEGEPPFTDDLEAWAAAAMPDFYFAWGIYKADQCHLPQSRGRVYCTGIKKEVAYKAGASTTLHIKEMLRPLPAMQPAALADFLEERSQMDPLPTAPGNKQNVFEYNRVFREIRDDAEKLSKCVDARVVSRCMSCDTSRRPTAEFGAFWDIEKVGCLTTQKRYIWLVGEVKHCLWGHGRWLTDRERCLCAGMRPSSLVPEMSWKQLVLALGNTMPPPQCGRAMTPLMHLVSCFQQEQPATPLPSVQDVPSRSEEEEDKFKQSKRSTRITQFFHKKQRVEVL